MFKRLNGIAPASHAYCIDARQVKTLVSHKKKSITTLCAFGLPLVLFFYLAASRQIAEPVLARKGFVIATYVADATLDHISAVFALKESLDAHDTRYSDFILMHDYSIPGDQLAFLGASDISCKLIFPKITVPLSLRQKLASHAKTRPLRDKEIWFQKLAIFRQLQDFHRVLYLDLDMMPLTNLTDLVMLAPITSAFPLAAVPEKPGLEPELQAGLLIFDPGLINFSEMLGRLNDADHKCGYRADDQSFLCHFFYERWHKLPRTFNVLDKASSSKEYGSSDSCLTGEQHVGMRT